ncbi:hypothetical protein WJX73_003129 [Symbiochloris irregularis]|uniref:Uncharacterized protein n=1 Tax=Symbiochloris irregularis TaxID=706552 RepID=A0AAW1NTY9_9CHLO
MAQHLCFLPNLAQVHSHAGVVYSRVQGTQDLTQIIVITRGLRQGPSGAPVLEVQYSCRTEEMWMGTDSNSRTSLMRASVRALPSLAHAESARMEHKVTNLAAMLLIEILVTNSARLDPKYKRECRQESGLSGSAFGTLVRSAGLLEVLAPGS